jgi:uncharacterized lipoprotein YajG
MPCPGIGFLYFGYAQAFYASLFCKENKMNKFALILFTLYTAFLASGCAEDPHSPYNSPDQQRARSDKAQDDMSSSMKK